MKTSEIHAGNEYGWASYRGGTERQVRVLATGLPGTKQRPYGGGYLRTAKQVSDGVRVEFLDDDQGGYSERFAKGATLVVPSREITRRWALVAREREQRVADQASACEIHRQARAGRAPKAKAVIGLLERVGSDWTEEISTLHVPRGSYADINVLATEAADAGFLLYFVEERRDDYYRVVTRYPGVLTYWLTGAQISLTAEQILALSELGPQPLPVANRRCSAAAG